MTTNGHTHTHTDLVTSSLLELLIAAKNNKIEELTVVCFRIESIRNKII